MNYLKSTHHPKNKKPRWLGLDVVKRVIFILVIPSSWFA
jgi:hypothetical protein